MFGLTSGNFISPSNVLSQIGVGSSGNARFHERATSTIQYQTPEFGGFQAGLQYAPTRRTTTSGAASPSETVTGTGLKSDLWSAGVKWEQGPIYLSAAIRASQRPLRRIVERRKCPQEWYRYWHVVESVHCC